MNERTYICHCCGDKCISAWTEEDAEAERRENFPETPTEECAEVCETCFWMLVEANKGTFH